MPLAAMVDNRQMMKETETACCFASYAMWASIWWSASAAIADSGGEHRVLRRRLASGWPGWRPMCFAFAAALSSENLRIAFPEKNDDERRKHRAADVGASAADDLRGCPSCSGSFTRRTGESIVRHSEQAAVDSVVSQARPKVCVTGHFGNFEALGHVCNFWGFRTYTVARTLDNPYLDRLVAPLSRVDGPADLSQERQCRSGRRSAANGRHPGASWAISTREEKAASSIFWAGRPRVTRRWPSSHCLTASPLMVATCTRTDRPLRFSMRMDAVLDPDDNPPEFASVEELTQWYNDVLARAFAEQPEQYWWLHDRWKEVAAGKRRKKRAPATTTSSVQRPAA